MRLQYHRNIPDRPPVDDIRIADVFKYDEIAPAMVGVDAVVHLAADSSTSADWASVRDRNIIGTFNVFESARLAGINKVVFASTNHVMGMYDRDRQWPIYDHQPVRPDSLACSGTTRRCSASSVARSRAAATRSASTPPTSQSRPE